MGLVPYVGNNLTTLQNIHEVESRTSDVHVKKKKTEWDKWLDFLLIIKYSTAASNNIRDIHTGDKVGVSLSKKKKNAITFPSAKPILCQSNPASHDIFLKHVTSESVTTTQFTAPLHLCPI